MVTVAWAVNFSELKSSSQEVPALFVPHAHSLCAVLSRFRFHTHHRGDFHHTLSHARAHTHTSSSLPLSPSPSFLHFLSHSLLLPQSHFRFLETGKMWLHGKYLKSISHAHCDFPCSELALTCMSSASSLPHDGLLLSLLFSCVIESNHVLLYPLSGHVSLSASLPLSIAPTCSFSLPLPPLLTLPLLLHSPFLLISSSSITHTSFPPLHSTSQKEN